jgi:hypothetical protein
MYINSYRKKERRPQLHPTGDNTDRQAGNAEHSSRGRRSAADEALETLRDRGTVRPSESAPTRRMPPWPGC